jgi:tetratricopeptide (TPR) repeat protein
LCYDRLIIRLNLQCLWVVHSMEKHVFISYKHDDSEFAENLIHRVEKEGFTTWIDNESLHPGDDWREGIDQAIRDAFALIVIMSPDAKASEYVTYEWAFAWGCGIKVIPVMYRATKLHPRLGSLQYLDFTNSVRPWDRLMRTLKRAESKALEASNVLQVAASQPLPSPAPVVSTASTEQKVQEWIDKGELFMDRKEYQEALEAFRQAILLDPNNAEAYAGKSGALWYLRKYQEALGASEQAIRLDSGLARAWVSKGDALADLKKYDEALTAYDEALLLDPRYPAAWDNKGATLAEIKRYSEALSACNEALRLEPDNANAWYNKGSVLNALKRYSEALSACDEALRLNPSDANAWHNKGNALNALKRYEEALFAYEKALRFGPTDVGLTWFCKGNAFKALGKSREAERCFKKARDLGYKDEED